MSETIVTKKCPTCKELKPLEQFYRNRSARDGYNTYCKSCAARYAASSQGRIIRRRYERSKKGRATFRRYNQSPKGIATSKKKYKISRERFPMRYRARKAVNHAVQKGKLAPISTRICHYCGNQASHYHHYMGYGEKYRRIVIPICHSCHKILHQGSSPLAS